MMWTFPHRAMAMLSFGHLAEAICEAVGRPTMRFVPVKIVEQQGILMAHRARSLLVRQRTMAANALRAHLAEFGLVATPASPPRPARRAGACRRDCVAALRPRRAVDHGAARFIFLQGQINAPVRRRSREFQRDSIE